MARNILLITTDQMRYDALGCNGGQVARTPVLDGLAAEGVRYTRAHNQNVVCMPARATIITGQHPATHGVWMNGVCLPEGTQTVAHELQAAGYRTALLGKAHFEPWLGKAEEFFENRMAAEGSTGPHRGFDHMELANHFFTGHAHYDLWMRTEHADHVDGFYPMVTPQGGQNYAGGGDTDAVQVWHNAVPRELYHTDWVAERTINWLGRQSADTPWFAWMSFPDPHHPWDPPASEIHRVPWRDLDLPALYSPDADINAARCAARGRHWAGYYDGSLWSNLESPRGFRPCDLTPDQVREIDAMNHIENELIDEACGRVLAFLAAEGQLDNTDVFFTTDHGELQGDFGLLFKGPYHCDALMRLPFLWRPARTAAVMPGSVDRPVGHLDLAPTFCSIAGIDVPAWMEGRCLPTEDSAAERDHVLTEWASEHGPVNVALDSIYHADGWLLTRYRPGSLYDGSEGELYDMNNDPQQLENRWADPALAAIKDDLLGELKRQLPAQRVPRLERRAPV